jgi:branched-chain amino acid transport system permease protein
VASGWPSVTKGDIGISIAGDTSVANLLLAQSAGYVLIAFVLMVVVIAACRLLVRSRLGYQLAAYRENEDAARSLGIATTRVRVIALIISAVITAIAGSIQAQYVAFISPPSEFSLTFSVQVAVIAIIGGLGTVYGPLFGAVLIVLLDEKLAPLVQHAAGLNQVVYGAILILVLLFFRRGIAGLGDVFVSFWLRRRGQRTSTPAAAASEELPSATERSEVGS